MYMFKEFTLNIKGQLMTFNEPIVMGIINITPDSFYANSRTEEKNSILERVKQLINEGADIIDIGAYSSRPGAKDISIKEELTRIEKGISIVRAISSNVIISIDTFRSEVAKYAIEQLDANIINDISGGDLDDKMHDTIASLNVPYVVNHMRGTPFTMQNYTDYKNVTTDVICDLGKKLCKLSKLGINDVIIDPGFGFSKTIEQNFQLLHDLKCFHVLNRPLLVGISRKSMIYKTLNISSEDALNGTSVINTMALINGASILRVHDVKEAKEAIKLVNKYFNINRL